MTIDKIICVGKNYLDHALELGDAVPEKPVLFLKPASVLKQIDVWGKSLSVIFPEGDTGVQPECEIVLQVAEDGFRMTKELAKRSISAVTLGLDMTLRACQSRLKKNGHPWTISKVFQDAAIQGPWIPINTFQDYLEEEFQLIIDGRVCQSDKGQSMTMQPVDLLMYISHFFPLKKGDIIYTGTPAGVTTITKNTSSVLQWGKYQYRVEWS